MHLSLGKKQAQSNYEEINYKGFRVVGAILETGERVVSSERDGGKAKGKGGKQKALFARKKDYLLATASSWHSQGRPGTADRRNEKNITMRLRMPISGSTHPSRLTCAASPAACAERGPLHGPCMAHVLALRRCHTVSDATYVPRPDRTPLHAWLPKRAASPTPGRARSQHRTYSPTEGHTHGPQLWP